MIVKRLCDLTGECPKDQTWSIFIGNSMGITKILISEVTDYKMKNTIQILDNEIKSILIDKFQPVIVMFIPEG